MNLRCGDDAVECEPKKHSPFEYKSFSLNYLRALIRQRLHRTSGKTWNTWCINKNFARVPISIHRFSFPSSLPFHISALPFWLSLLNAWIFKRKECCCDRNLLKCSLFVRKRPQSRATMKPAVKEMCAINSMP